MTGNDQMPVSEPQAAESAGFSLIEVMIATTVLMIIVLMVAMVFQQSTGAWSGGTRRANAAMTLRSVLGQMQRELTEAVDAREFTNAIGMANTFTPHLADFVALIGDPASAEEGPRVPHRIRFERVPASAPMIGYAVRRIRTRLRFDAAAGRWVEDPASTRTTLLNSSQGLSDFEMTRLGNPDDPSGLPLCVDILAQVDESRASMIVKGRSAGRDKLPNTKDDISAGQ